MMRAVAAALVAMAAATGGSGWFDFILTFYSKVPYLASVWEFLIEVSKFRSKFKQSLDIGLRSISIRNFDPFPIRLQYFVHNWKCLSSWPI